tara:strand:- start:914 stop:1123 length:210 start_codon:yes stop_codon:yes gene_type:complete
MKRLIDFKLDIPEGSIGILNGLFYKVGTHNFSYYWDGEQWLKSGKHPALIEAAIEACRHKFSFDNGVTW